ncbi:MAG: helix-turn-helix domain-containing protein [Planctomycetota bacterium]|nr:helix-turn-helix domain-containing protein [Planctomycetota bacterium]
MNSEAQILTEDELKMTEEGRRPRCPNPDCPDKTLHDVIIHSRDGSRTRYCCKVCGKTFSVKTGERRGRGMSRKPKVRYALWLANQGYSKSEIAFIVGVTRRTVMRWLKKLKVE